MIHEFNCDSKELARFGILETYFKKKLRHYYTKNLQNSISKEQQIKIINNWKKNNSIKSNSELEQWLHLYELNIDEWINLINSDYLWTYWCMDKYKKELT